MQEEFKKLSVSDKEVSDYYAQNQEQFIMPEKLKARHILLQSEDDAKSIIKTTKLF